MSTTHGPHDPSGFLPVDKPSGPTSHDVVDLVRRALKTRRVGHAGTLDPFASGLLILAVGKATKDVYDMIIFLPLKVEELIVDARSRVRVEDAPSDRTASRA